MEITHTRKMQWPEVAQGRFASTIRTDSPKGCQIALLGIPDDTGVALNGGHPGAASGPDALRVALTRYGTSEPDDWVWPAIFDAGDVIPTDDLHETHARVTSVTSDLLDAGLFPIAIGGGHDLTFPFVRAANKRFGEMCGIYFDAHLDVRDKDGSGMPFRKLTETCSVRRLDAIGISPFVNSREHTRWFHSHGGRIDALEPHGDWPGEHIFISFDMDVLDASVAPGVSARNPQGWDTKTATSWVYAAGACDRVRCFDIMELCPPNDHDGRTARVAAHLLLTFLRGFTKRNPGTHT